MISSDRNASLARSKRILPLCQSAACFNSMTSRNSGSAVLVISVVRRLSGLVLQLVVLCMIANIALAI